MSSFSSAPGACNSVRPHRDLLVQREDKRCWVGTFQCFESPDAKRCRNETFGRRDFEMLDSGVGSRGNAREPFFGSMPGPLHARPPDGGAGA